LPRQFQADISSPTATLRQPQLSALPSAAKRQSAHYKTTVPILHTATKLNAAVITQPSLGQDVQGREGYWVAPCQRDPRIGPVPQQRSQ
jgi:hypothetical protein